MEIGGQDFVIEGETCRDDIDFMLRYFREFWPQGIFETVDGKAVPLTSPNLLPALPPMEFFLYRSPHDAETWAKVGRTDECRWPCARHGRIRCYLFGRW